MKRFTIKISGENGLYLPNIRKIVGCYHSTALRNYSSFEAINSIDNLPIT